MRQVIYYNQREEMLINMDRLTKNKIDKIYLYCRAKEEDLYQKQILELNNFEIIDATVNFNYNHLTGEYKHKITGEIAKPITIKDIENYLEGKTK